jgi:hypothetical protein
VAIGLDRVFIGCLEVCAVLGFEALELAAFPLAVGAIGLSGAVEGVWADFAADYFPGSAVFIGFGKA